MVEPSRSADSIPPMPLVMAGAGEWVRVAGVAGGCGAVERLAELGLLVGTAVQVVRPSTGGPVLIELRGSRLALGYGLAAKVIVQELPARPNVAADPNRASA